MIAYWELSGNMESIFVLLFPKVNHRWTLFLVCHMHCFQLKYVICAAKAECHCIVSLSPFGLPKFSIETFMIETPQFLVAL